MSNIVTEDVIRLYMDPPEKPLTGLKDTGDAWGLAGGPCWINKRRASYSDGYHHNLRPESHFYKRAFHFPDLDARGLAIVFRLIDPVDPNRLSEYFSGWVPPEREAEADQWIAFLNGEIKARLREAAEKAGAG